MSSKRPIYGFTLLEVMVYATLSIALLGGVTLYVQSGLQLYRSGDSYKEAQKDAMLTLRKMTGELANSTFASKAGGERIVFPEEAEHLVIFPSADDLGTNEDSQVWVHDETTGDLLWRKWVMFSLNQETNTLEKRESPMKRVSKENLGQPPVPEDFSGIVQSYGRNIDQVTISWLEPGRVLEVVLWTKKPPQTGSREGTRIEMRTSVRVEN